MAFERIPRDANPGNKLHCAAKALVDKEKTAPLDGLDGKSSRCLNKCEENVDNMEVVMHKQNMDPEGVEISLSLFAAADTNQHADCNDKSSINNNQLLFEFRDENNSLDQVLGKIEIVHAKVPKLRNQLDQVMSKNVSKFPSSENLSFLAACDAQTSSSPSPTFLVGNGDTTSADLYLTQLNKFANMLEIRSCLQVPFQVMEKLSMFLILWKALLVYCNLLKLPATSHNL
ncbi:hypothetical protein V6N13_083386 [Hibiscus sabdariffa]|uniref:Uncharacterized protein n=1 Tax=Hibiscus sabdariffa TaxID=183260 RepID=A0ABR2SXV9_9ROSI